METATFLEIFSVQRHDFLNHLQVISGLVQLNKSDRVTEYISQVCQEAERLSRVAHLNVPEVAAVLLVTHFTANKHQVEIIYDINTNLAGCNVPDRILAEALEEIVKQSLACLAPPDKQDRRLKISINESEKKYLFRVSFHEPNPGEAELAQARLAGVGKKIMSYDGKVGIVVSGSVGEIFMVFPRQVTGQG